MKPSRYLVTAPFPSEGTPTHWLVYHTVHGSVALLDAKTWESFQVGPKDGEAPSELFLQAQKAGYIVSNEDDELSLLLDENELSGKNLKSWYQVIMPSAACQLACNESSCGAYCGQTHSANMLSIKHQDDIAQRIKDRLVTGQYDDLEIGWFGGEPLLGLGAIERLSPILKKLANDNSCIYRARMVTNGLKLSLPIAQKLITQHGVRAIEITLDGDAKFHDLRRCTKDKHLPTFEAILSNIVAIAADSNLDICTIKIRCNVDRRNVDGVKPLLERLAALRLQKRIQFYAAPVHPWGNAVEEISISPKDFATFEIQVFKWMQDLGFDIQLLPKRRTVTCAATNPHAEVIDPFGNIHNCTEAPLVKTYETIPNARKTLQIIDSKPVQRQMNKYSSGNLNGEVNHENQGLSLRGFSAKVRNNEYQCSSCPMLPVCGGRCPLSWSHGHVPCPSPKFNITERLQMWFSNQQTERLRAAA